MTTEFGRTPYHEQAEPRWPGAIFTTGVLVLAGWRRRFGGGPVHGASDDYGIAVADDRVHVHDFHATILNLLGLDHERLTFRHAGRDYRLTDVEGEAVRDILR